MRGIVLGGADCVWDDLEAAQKLGDYDGVIVCNDAGTKYAGDVHIWATLHPEHLGRWTKEREKNGLPKAQVIAAHKGNTQQGRKGAFPVDYVTSYQWPGMSGSGSSGLFSIKVALEFGYDRLVLCGIPMQAARAHFFDKKPWHDVGSFANEWPRAMPHLRKTVRSMSGWTRELLGKPTPKWLETGETVLARLEEDGERFIEIPQGSVIEARKQKGWVFVRVDTIEDGKMARKFIRVSVEDARKMKKCLRLALNAA